jgi:hypothetical protein
MQLTQRFELRKDTSNKKGEHPVTLIIRVASQRRKFASGVTAIPELWDNETQRLLTVNGNLKKSLLKKYSEVDLPSNFDLKRANISLDDLSNAFNNIAAKFDLDNISYSADMLLESYKLLTSPKTKKNESHNLVFDFIDQYIADNLPAKKEVWGFIEH